MTSSQAETTLKQNGQPHKSPLINQGLRWPWTLVSFSCTSQRVFRMAGHLSSGKFALGTTLACSVFFFIYGLGLLVTPFLCQWFVEPKDKTGLNPYHNKYLFLSEGRASPIYLCIFVQRQVGFQCICNLKKKSLFFQGWVQEDWKPVHSSLISSWCSLHQCAREHFALWNGFWL